MRRTTIAVGTQADRRAEGSTHDIEAGCVSQLSISVPPLVRGERRERRERDDASIAGQTPKLCAQPREGGCLRSWAWDGSGLDWTAHAILAAVESNKQKPPAHSLVLSDGKAALQHGACLRKAAPTYTYYRRADGTSASAAPVGQRRERLAICPSEAARASASGTPCSARLVRPSSRVPVGIQSFVPLRRGQPLCALARPRYSSGKQRAVSLRRQHQLLDNAIKAGRQWTSGPLGAQEAEKHSWRSVPSALLP